MLRKVNSYIRAHRLISSGDTIIVAVSGGADSVALLDVLASLRSSKLRLIVAHLNHCLRGSESDADEAFVRKLAGKYGVCFVTKAVDVLALSRESKMSLEEAGRVARYRFFKELAINCKARSVAVAHHADDQAETVLMRLIRGAGGSGLRAMTSTTAGLIIRPLLSVTRREIESYLDKKGLGYRTDSSNADLNFLRNRIRHELIPFLRVIIQPLPSVWLQPPSLSPKTRKYWRQLLQLRSPTMPQWDRERYPSQSLERIWNPGGYASACIGRHCSN
ncbi:tRNA lysidine(34) synthetase TilS [Geotalea toluenoxydans]|uniref:tRNA lysidine(34) synthetase TilS n=1 Tax=Geotalea toluenoxydans TaxID=421624 RepID=UPI000A6729C2|nr:tRNA lysidine(34) synthetase TilS [Geotalea toluenoxydans]